MILTSKILRRTAIRGFALYPFIVVRPELKEDWVLLNHERIHLQQQKELLVLPFLVLYFLHYLFNMVLYFGYAPLAYRRIVFEREAREQERDLGYLAKRKRYAWLRPNRQR